MDEFQLDLSLRLIAWLPDKQSGLEFPLVCGTAEDFNICSTGRCISMASCLKIMICSLFTELTIVQAGRQESLKFVLPCRVSGDGTVTNRPLAGTRPRGADAESDKKLEEELLADDKELSEHVMLVDLGRNDVGKV